MRVLNESIERMRLGKMLMNPSKLSDIAMVLCVVMLALPITAEEAGEEVAEETAAENQSPTAEELLKRKPKTEDYVEYERCINRRLVRKTEVLDDRHIAFQVSRSEYYLAQFEHRCIGMRRKQPIQIVSRGSGICEFDRVRPIDDFGGGAMLGAVCSMPKLQKITKEQLVALKDTIQADERAAREARRKARQERREAKAALKAAKQKAEDAQE